MKKNLALLLCIALLLSCTALAACGKQDVSSSRYVGTYKAVSATMMGETVPAEEVFDYDVILELNADGTGRLTSGTEDDGTFTWKETNEGVKTSGDAKLTLKDTGEGLDASVIGVHLLFVKQP